MTIRPVSEKGEYETNLNPDISIAVFNELIYLINPNKHRYGETEFNYNGTTISYKKYDIRAIDQEQDPAVPAPESIEIKVESLLTIKLTRDFSTNKPNVTVTIEPGQDIDFLPEEYTKENQDVLLHLIYQLLTNDQAVVAIKLERDAKVKKAIIDTTKGFSIRLTEQEKEEAQELWLSYDPKGESTEQSHTRKIGEIRGDQLIFQFNLTVHPAKDLKVFLIELSRILKDFYYGMRLLNPSEITPESESKRNYQAELPPYSDYMGKDIVYQPEIQEEIILTELFNKLIRIRNIVGSDNFKIKLDKLILSVKYRLAGNKVQFIISSEKRGLEQDLVLTKSKNEQTDRFEIEISSRESIIFRILLEHFNLTLEYPNILQELSTNTESTEDSSRLRIETKPDGAVQFIFENNTPTFPTHKFPFAFNRWIFEIDDDKVSVRFLSNNDNRIISDQEVRNKSLKNLIIQLLTQILQGIKEKTSSNSNDLKAIQETSLEIGSIQSIFTDPEILTILENEAKFFSTKDRYLELGFNNRFFKIRLYSLGDKYRAEIIYYTTENHDQKTFFFGC
ncbi:MAG: hypothetical protein KatS3mg090_0354 [Patescibacteria group bacterium]|nr:MAG: hypothetical protein KatS3mg090_0354 [Patescibacteria group bacterium]